MMSIIKKWGLRPIGLIVLGGLVACSSTQKMSYSQMQQRVPLSEEQQDERIKEHTLKITEHTQKMIKSVHQAMALNVTKIALPDYKVDITSVKKQSYFAPSWTWPLAALASLGLTVSGAILIPSVALNMSVSTAAISGILFGSHAAYQPMKDWPYRIKVVYAAKDKLSHEKFTGHCSAYFINSKKGTLSLNDGLKTLPYAATDHRVHESNWFSPDYKEGKDGKKFVLHAGDKGKIMSLTIPFEIDGCTHESIFPENKQGQMRIGHDGQDIFDKVLGQHAVVATGDVTVRWVDKKTKKMSGDTSSVHYKTHMIQLLTEIKSHKTKFETLVPLN